ncbi:protein FAR-RED IMPAIRED RESPONSE 1-like [Bidens hawaiensis]|uniref:protein FAR-RED IMPAIRED RESPONSE 1-like n=1 Tax=Bidens hawaiensis TaxID=980011 RepID=UPI00404B5DA7
MNLRPVKAFNLMRTQYGSFEKVGATKDDCKNFKQSLNCYIGEYDAEMIVQRLCAKRKFSSDYSFEYDVNDDRELIHVFWADEISKTSETIESYIWLLQIFLKSFGSAPKVVVTDHDPAMKQAIASVGADLSKNEDFKSRLYNIVWTDSISPSEFEDKWQTIMVEFEVDKNKWLTDKDEIRFDWISAFIETNLCPY